MTTKAKTRLNGVDIEQMQETVEAVKTNPNLAKFNFRLTNKWVKGGHNRSRIKEFYGAGQEDTTRKEPYILDADEPPILLGEDQAANPAEYLLHALAACMTTSMVYHAAARGIKIDSIESEVEGDADLHGFLGLSDSVRPGFQNIRARITVQSDAPAEELEELIKFSPIYDTVSKPVSISVKVENSR